MAAAGRRSADADRLHYGWVVVGAAFSVLVGLIFGLAGPAGAVGPLLGGLVFDATGHDAWAFGTGAALNLAALGFLVRARPPVAGAAA